VCITKNQNPKAIKPQPKRLPTEVSDFKDILAIASGKNWEPVKRSGRFINANYPPKDATKEELEAIAEFGVLELYNEFHKTKDILHVKEILGHKSLLNTMLYTQLIAFKDDDFTARVAHSEQESCQLIEAGFEFVCDFNGNKLFRKRK
jgi:hypothetical protein